jgi:alpha-N-arabinofuranosidase
MKDKMIKRLIYGLLFLILVACNSTKTDEQKYFKNPILAGYYPDPSICRVDNNYYLVNSSFSHYPGIPIFQSTDLVNWKQIGHVLDRPSQLDLDGLAVSEGIFAPAISYNKGTFYLITTLVGNGGNFVVTAKDPAGPWSDPKFLPDVPGIDPSLFFDSNGKTYIVHNGGAPDNKPQYDGHRAIWLYEFDPVNLEVISEKKLLVDGGTDITKKPIWIEGPHIYKRNDYYYLIAAEGGTGYNHSEVVFRSRTVDGPYEPWKGNPILTQKHLDPGRINPVTNTGHADFIQTQNNEWWAVFLGCRPYKENIYNTGRETFLAHVNWTEDGWPKIEPYQQAVRLFDSIPNLEENIVKDFPKNDNFILKDDFIDSTLEHYWIFLRTCREKWYDINNGSLDIKLRPESITERKNISLVARRQQHTSCTAIAKMNFTPADTNEIAGIVSFQNEEFFYLLGKKIVNNNIMLGVFSYDKTTNQMITLAIEPATGDEQLLKIEIAGELCSFSVKDGDKDWQTILKNADNTILSTEKAGGFVGAILGMYASSNGKQSENTVKFDWFEYKGDDEIFNLN